MLRKINHIGIVVEDFERAVERFRGFGLQCTEVMENREMGLRMAFFSLGDTMIEVICQMGPDKGQDVVLRVVREQKGGLNHLCFQVDDLEKTIQDFEKNGAKLVEAPKSGAHGRVAFFYPETTEGVLIELCQL